MRYIDTKEIKEKWEHIRFKLEPLVNKDYSIDLLRLRLLDKAVQLWEIVPNKGYIVCSFTQDKVLGTKTLNVLYLVGFDMKAWVNELVHFGIIVAKQANCNSIQFKGRLGFIRALQRYGYKFKHAVVELEI